MTLHLQSSSVPGRALRSPVLLCVDDAAMALQVRAEVLSRHGYDVIAVDNAEEALRLLRCHPVDAIITDYEMPGMNGGLFAATVKFSSHACPIVLHSGCAEIPASAMQHIDAFAPKGQPVAALLAKVHLLLFQLPRHEKFLSRPGAA